MATKSSSAKYYMGKPLLVRVCHDSCTNALALWPVYVHYYVLCLWMKREFGLGTCRPSSVVGLDMDTSDLMQAQVSAMTTVPTLSYSIVCVWLCVVCTHTLTCCMHIIELVLRHFHRYCYRSNPLWLFLLKRALISWSYENDENMFHHWRAFLTH
jgi:hypothetical protein